MTLQKQKVLVLAHSPFVGGGELALKSLIDSTKEIYEWVVVIPEIGDINERITSSEPVYHTLPALTWWCYEAHNTPSRINQSKLRSSLRKLTTLAETADILMTNTMTIPWLGFIAQQINKPHIWYIHEYGDKDHNLKFIAGYDESLRMIAKSSSRVLTISNDVRDHIGRVIPPDQIDLIHQSIEFSRLTSLPASTELDDLSILCLGAIKPSKGQLVALEAVSQLPNATLDIIGAAADQRYAELLLERASSQPNISVQVRSYDPAKELLTHNILLMCSNNEGLGRVTLEGLAARRLVVGYGCRSTSELLADNRGIIYSPNNAAALKATLDTVQTAARLVNLDQAQSFVVQTYSDQMQAADFTQCITNAIASTPPTGNLLQEHLALISQLGLWETPSYTLKATVKKLIPHSLKRLIKRLLPR